MLKDLYHGDMTLQYFTVFLNLFTEPLTIYSILTRLLTLDNLMILYFSISQEVPELPSHHSSKLGSHRLT